MYDILIRGGDVVDGTGSAPAPRRRRASRATAWSPSASSPAARMGGRRHHRRHRQGRRTRASSTCTRTTTRRCSGTARSRRRRCTASPPRRGQLRLHHRAAVRRRRRRRLPHAHAGARRGHAARVAAHRRAVELDDDRRVLRRDRRAARHQRRVHGRPLGDPPRRDGRGVDRRASRRPTSSTRCSALLRAGLDAGGARVLVVVGAHPQRRRRPHGAVALRDARRARRAVPTRPASSRARRSSSSRMVGPGSSRGPSSSWPTCRPPRSDRSTGTCSASTASNLDDVLAASSRPATYAREHGRQGRRAHDPDELPACASRSARASCSTPCPAGRTAMLPPARREAGVLRRRRRAGDARRAVAQATTTRCGCSRTGAT